MSAQKALAQAERLLQRGKLQEAADELEETLQADSSNEIVASKLALIYIDLGEKSKSVGLYCQTAKRASEAGKSRKAIALLKQALNLNPRDPRVLLALAKENEQLGKLSAAKQYINHLLDFCLPRKRYLDAIEACASLVRYSPNEEEPKIKWIELLQLRPDDDQVISAIVVICAPPGMMEDDDSTDKDSTELSDGIVWKLKELLLWYPTNPFISYALAWTYYKQQDQLKALEYIKESLRIDPNFILSMFLYVRILIDMEKLQEAQFVYFYAKENMSRDQRTEIKLLNDQAVAFEESNGWKPADEDTITDGNSGLSPDDFLKMIRGIPLEEDAELIEEEPAPKEFYTTSMIQLNEIDLSGGVEFTSFISTDSLEEDSQDADGDDETVVEDAAKGQERSSDLLAAKSPKLDISGFIESSSEEEPGPESPSDPEADIIRSRPKLKLFNNFFGKKAKPEEDIFETSEVISEPEASATPPPPPPKPKAPVDSSPPLPQAPSTSTPPVVDPRLDQILAKKQLEVLEKTTVTPEEKVKEVIAPPQVEGEQSESASPDMLFKDRPKKSAAFIEDQTNRFLLDVEKISIPGHVEYLNLAKKYLKQKKYYIARKACRESLKAGADEEKIKELLREIRKKEFPDSMYAHFSADNLMPPYDLPTPSGETVKAIIDRLDADFELNLENEEETLGADFKNSLIHMRAQINQELDDATPEVRMDLGVAFFEMRLFEEAEHIFENTFDTSGTPNLDALYLAAESMAQRGNYVRAVTLLHKICKSTEREDSENLSAYYLLGKAYEAMNQKKRSVRYYKKAAEIDINYRDLKSKLR